MMDGSWSDWHWGFGFGHWIFGILFWVLIFVLILSLVRGIGFLGGGSQPESGSALDILKARYARGEIDKDEYERMRRELER